MAQKYRFVLSLITRDSDYQVEEAAEAEKAAQELGVDLKVIFADGNAVTQSQQLLDEVYARGADQAAGIIVQPVGTNLPQVAKVAGTRGIGWVVLNREAEYLDDLRRAGKAPAFEVVSDHKEIGRIQGRQMAVLLPKGGMALYLEGPSMNPTVQQRKMGLMETKPGNIQLCTIRSQWDRSRAASAVSAWLRLGTPDQARIEMIAAQTDTLAMGARDALESSFAPDKRDHWLALPLLGCDGCRNTGRVWTDHHLLTATVHIPLLSGVAVRLLHQALLQKPVEARTLMMPESYPAIDRLPPHGQRAGAM